MKNKLIRNITSETTKRLNTLKEIYKLETTAKTIEFILERFFSDNEQEIKDQYNESFNEFLKNKKGA